MKFPGDGGILPWPKDLDPSIIFQCEVIRDMQKMPGCNNPAKGMDVPVIVDRHDGKMLTRVEFFDRHAMTLWAIREVEQRTAEIQPSYVQTLYANGTPKPYHRNAFP